MLKLLLAALLITVHAEDIIQCKCSDAIPCVTKYVDALKPCMDICAAKEHLGDGPINIPAVKDCLNDKHAVIQASIDCFRAKHANSCAKDTPKQVPKTDAEALKGAVITEVLAMIDKAGAVADVAPLIATAKRMSNCMQKCAEKRSDGCWKAMNCGLELGTQAEIIASAKECSKGSGITPVAMKAVCECGVKNGMTSLAGACTKIPV